MASEIFVKLCIKCNEYKSVEAFTPKLNCCKGCIAAYAKEYFHKNREIVLKRNRDWRRDNPEKSRAHQKKYYQTHDSWGKKYPDKKAEADRKYHTKNKEKTNAKQRVYYHSLPLEEKKKRNAAWGDAYPDKRKSSQRRYQRRKNKEDPQFRLIRNLRNRLYQALYLGQPRKDYYV